jgi:hypothetical protein
MSDTSPALPDETVSRDDRERKLLVVWERAIQTQMHFAELSIKTRQVGMTVVGATLGLAIVLHRAGFGFILSLGSYEFPISSILCWTAAMVLFAIGLLDVGVYHRMLRGAVAFNEQFEQNNLLDLFRTEKGLTQAISFFSRNPNAALEQNSFVLRGGRHPHYAGNRIIVFYFLMIVALVGAGIALKVAGVE